MCSANKYVHRETTEAVEKLLRLNRRLKIIEIATQLDLLKTTVHEIVYEKLNFYKVYTHWVQICLHQTTKTNAYKYFLSI